MRSFNQLPTALLVLLATTTTAWPAARLNPVPVVDDGSAPLELLGDLKNGITTPTGQLIADIISGPTSGQSQAIGKIPLTTAACKADPCCVWYGVSVALTLLFKGAGGRCNDNARAAVRLGFHDAGTWSKQLTAQGQDFGGADGSLLMKFGEDGRKENNGLQGIIAKLRVVQATFKVGYADLVQYAANHATVTCPLGPRIRTFIGRKDATRAAPDGLLPDVRADPDSLIALFEDKTFDAHSLAALLGAHSTSRQFNFDTKRSGAPQDSTPGVWDVNFYNETIQTKPRKQLVILPSDVALAKHPKISDEWNSFINDQNHWNEDYATAYVRMSLLGVPNINNLTECTMTLPKARPGEKALAQALDATE